MLYNEIVEDAAARFNPSDTLAWKQIGASTWKSEERAIFFAALDRIGRHDVPAIAKAIGTKSIAEVRQYIMLLDGAEEHHLSTLQMSDVPAAVEISPECERQLEIARDGLMCRQERFEVTRERERYGDYWLITPDIADEIEAAHMPSRRSSFGSSPPPNPGEMAQTDGAQEEPPKPQILQDVPEGDLLVPTMMLELSRTLFMNGHPNPLSANPHWSNFTSPLAPEPSLYRSALMDFHTLAVSLTKRLVQATIYQATSRIRAQGWRTQKGPSRNVGKRDVLAALDILRLERNGRERWKTVARRCRLRVVRGRQKDGLVEVDWREVEQVPNFKPDLDDYATGDETAGSGRESVHDFRARSMRAGTPLPSRDRASSDQESAKERQEEDFSSDDESEYSDVYDSQAEDGDASPVSEHPITAEEREEMEEQALENFDAEASKEEEHRLFEMLGVEQTPSQLKDAHAFKSEEEENVCKTAMLRDNHHSDWKTWISYRAAWEEHASPPPRTAFNFNRKSPSPRASPFEQTDIETGISSDVEEVAARPKRKRRKVTETELPIRGARAYAALQEQASGTGISDLEEEGSAEFQKYVEDDDAKPVVQSIEEPHRFSSRVPSSRAPSTDFMDWDWKSALETSYM